MVHDVPTRWNSTAELIQRALELAPALKILVVEVEHNKPGCGVRLKRFQLSPEEWKLLSALSPLLDVSLLHESLITSLIIMLLDLSSGNKEDFDCQDALDSSGYPHIRCSHHCTRGQY